MDSLGELHSGGVLMRQETGGLALASVLTCIPVAIFLIFDCTLG